MTLSHLIVILAMIAVAFLLACLGLPPRRKTVTRQRHIPNANNITSLMYRAQRKRHGWNWRPSA